MHIFHVIQDRCKVFPTQLAGKFGPEALVTRIAVADDVVLKSAREEHGLYTLWSLEAAMPQMCIRIGVCDSASLQQRMTPANTGR
jgi:hypothetical protein